MKLFSHPSILKQIGQPRLALFFSKFSDDLQAANIVLPEFCPSNDEYYVALAALLASPGFPARAKETISRIELLAAPQNADQLNAAIQRYIPCVSLAGLLPVDRALELWFYNPDAVTDLCPSLLEQSPETDRIESPEPVTELSSIKKQNAGSAIESSVPSLPCLPCLPSTKNHVSRQSQTAADQPSPNFASDKETFESLAKLSEPDYDRVRKIRAADLCIRVETLDAQVARFRVGLNQDAEDAAFQAILATLHTPEPWPEPVNGAETFRQVATRYSHYLFLPLWAPETISLWSGHAHAFTAFRLSPRLNLRSPEAGCGKTTTLDVIATMVPRPIRTENLTAPTLFRLVDQFQPTLLLDEVDSYINQAEELRGLLNAGNKRGSCAYRCAGEGNALRAFKAFAPAILSGIGSLPGTLHDRSIIIPLLKAQPGEIANLFNEENLEIETILCRKLARWTRDNFVALQTCNPEMPKTAHNRQADNWRPLFAIAQVAGGDWPDIVTQSFNQLSARDDRDAQSIGINLLADIRQIFLQSRVDRLSSRHLVLLLCSMPGSPWLEAHNNRPINETWLGRRLRSFDIDSRTMWFGDHQAKGYDFKDFKDVFARFLPPLSPGEADGNAALT
jgi:hypothetical protein